MPQDDVAVVEDVICVLWDDVAVVEDVICVLWDVHVYLAAVR